LVPFANKAAVPVGAFPKLLALTTAVIGVTPFAIVPELMDTAVMAVTTVNEGDAALVLGAKLGSPLKVAVAVYVPGDKVVSA
jgi:hypothetical protein